MASYLASACIIISGIWAFGKGWMPPGVAAAGGWASLAIGVGAIDDEDEIVAVPSDAGLRMGCGGADG